MKLKSFQKQDLARAALHDGLILSWDTGLGKTWAIYLWLLLKVGHTTEAVGSTAYFPPKAGSRACAPNAQRLRPKQPVLILAPGDLHQQIVDEGWERFGIVVQVLDSQATFQRLTRRLQTAQSFLDEQGRPILAPDFYITSYSQLTTNGVERMPDPTDPDLDPTALLQRLSLTVGTHVPTTDVARHCAEANVYADWATRPDFTSAAHLFAWRGVRWADAWRKLDLSPETATTAMLADAYARQRDTLDGYRGNPEALAKQVAALDAARDLLARLITTTPNPALTDLPMLDQEFVLREFIAERLGIYAAGDGQVQTYEQLDDGTWRNPKAESGKRKAETQNSELTPENSPPPAVARVWPIKCVYSPSLSDLAYNAFRGMAIDEGVKMKGADTYVGLGVRQMDPEYRLVLTATPIKNRAPDIFHLAHWATGGRPEAHARFPMGPGDQTVFAESFMVSESNLTRLEDARESGSSSGGRYKKLTAEVCNIHRLWKLLAPIVLRRRKDECNEDIVPKIRKVIRCQMGTLQADTYQYHLDCEYTDCNGEDAIGARLQALRMAAADPASAHLREQGGDPTKPCRCTKKPVPPEEQRERLQATLTRLTEALAANPVTQVRLELEHDIEATQAELAAPILRFDTIEANPECPVCQGEGTLPLIPRSPQPYIPKHASVLSLIQEILARGEQVLVGAAFNDPLDHLAQWLDEANVRHLKLDGRTSQKKRGQAAAVFKRGRVHLESAIGNRQSAIPVMLAGVECMAEGHSFHLANNVILLAYSWAYDKFIQFINRVHRMTSAKPVNVYVVVCEGTIDGRLESLIGEKGDSSELVLDGRLLGERSEEVDLAQLLKVAQQEFDSASETLDEAMVQAQWPALRDQLRTAMTAWDEGAEVKAESGKPNAKAESGKRKAETPKPYLNSKPKPQPSKLVGLPATVPTSGVYYDPVAGKYVTVTPVATLPPPPPSKAEVGKRKAETPNPQSSIVNRKSEIVDWRQALRPERKLATVMVSQSNPWDAL